MHHDTSQPPPPRSLQYTLMQGGAGTSNLPVQTKALRSEIPIFPAAQGGW